MTTKTDAKGAPRRCTDEGAVVVEFALVLPILVVLMLGLLDFGFVFRQGNAAESATSGAARVAATNGAYRYSDFEALRAVDGGVSGMRRVAVKRVIIYKDTSGSNEPPAACRAIPVAPGDLSPKGIGGVCNVYSGAQVKAPTTAGFGSPSIVNPTCAPGSWDQSWCPTGRVAPSPGEVPDNVGVFVELEYQPLTGILGATPFTVERNAVYQVEPCIDGLSLYDCAP